MMQKILTNLVLILAILAALAFFSPLSSMFGFRQPAASVDEEPATEEAAPVKSDADTVQPGAGETEAPDPEVTDPGPGETAVPEDGAEVPDGEASPEPAMPSEDINATDEPTELQPEDQI